MNKKINESFEINLDLSKSDIIDFFKHGKQSQSLLDSIFTDKIDFDEVDIKSGQIEITRMPKATSALRPYGKIIIGIAETDLNTTCLNFEVRPFNNTFPIILIVGIIFMVLWSFTSILFSSGQNLWMIILTGWGIASLVIFLSYKIFKNILLRYAKQIISEIEAAANNT